MLQVKLINNEVFSNKIEYFQQSSANLEWFVHALLIRLQHATTKTLFLFGTGFFAEACDLERTSGSPHWPYVFSQDT